MKNFVKYTSIGLLSSVIFLGFSINLSAQNDTSETHEIQSKIIVGAENTTNYLSKLKGKKIGLISNQTGIATVNGITMHTVDLFLKNNLNVVKLYSPEHGFRG
ncbi:exo-beta-N-acetylmuramidase NamZ domain-containing protein, partial [Empedobacter brevis]